MEAPRARVGTCGFQRARRLHYEKLDAVEVQQTFYDPPPPERLEKWRSEAPESFEFTVKAWMLVTHEYNSRLWRRLKRRVPGDPREYGGFKLNERTLWAWRVTLEAAAALNARIVVVQTPPSFGYTSENAERIIEFFRHVPREGVIVAWEPRGSWWLNRDALYETARRAGLIVAGDILRGRLPSERQEILYARLHGLGGGEVNYRYKYSIDDLRRIIEILRSSQHREAYIMFNNVYAYDDAVALKKLLEAGGEKGVKQH